MGHILLLSGDPGLYPGRMTVQQKTRLYSGVLDRQLKGLPIALFKTRTHTRIRHLTAHCPPLTRRAFGLAISFAVVLCGADFRSRPGGPVAGGHPLTRPHETLWPKEDWFGRPDVYPWEPVPSIYCLVPSTNVYRTHSRSPRIGNQLFHN